MILHNVSNDSIVIEVSGKKCNAGTVYFMNLDDRKFQLKSELMSLTLLVPQYQNLQKI